MTNCRGSWVVGRGWKSWVWVWVWVKVVVTKPSWSVCNFADNCTHPSSKSNGQRTYQKSAKKSNRQNHLELERRHSRSFNLGALLKYHNRRVKRNKIKFRRTQHLESRYSTNVKQTKNKPLSTVRN